MNNTKIFPIEVKVTQRMIDKGRKHSYNPERCIGALALTKGLTKAFGRSSFAISWVVCYGFYRIPRGKWHSVATDRNMMRIRKPTTVTFTR